MRSTVLTWTSILAIVTALPGCHHLQTRPSVQPQVPRTMRLAWTAAETDYTYCLRWAGIEAYARDCADTEKYPDWVMCHGINPLWTMRH